MIRRSCFPARLPGDRFPRAARAFTALARGVALGALISVAGSAAHAQSAPRVVAYSVPSGTFSTQQVREAGAALYSRVRAPDARYAVKRYDLRVRSTDERGEPVVVRAQLFVPQMPAAQRVPVYVLGPGTTGLADGCSVFREDPAKQSWGWYQGHMLSYASQGFISLIVDYAYFEDPERLQPYFVSASEARILLDGARSVFEFMRGMRTNAQPAQAVFFSGYSQGGHSSFAAADLARSYAPDVPVRGVVAFGGTQDVQVLLREHASFAPYVIASYEAYYGRNVVDSAKVLRRDVLAGLDRNARARCVGDLHAMYGRKPHDVFTKEFADALVKNSIGRKWPRLARALALNRSGLTTDAAGIPAFVAQGSTDDIVTAGAQRSYVGRLCGLGRAVTYREYPGINHYQTRQVAAREAMDWMRSVTDGRAIINHCPRLASN